MMTDQEIPLFTNLPGLRNVNLPAHIEERNPATINLNGNEVLFNVPTNKQSDPKFYTEIINYAVALKEPHLTISFVLVRPDSALERDLRNIKFRLIVESTNAKWSL